MKVSTSRIWAASSITRLEYWNPSLLFFFVLFVLFFVFLVV